MRPQRSCFCFASLVCCTANLLTALFPCFKTEPTQCWLHATRVPTAFKNRRFQMKTIRKFASAAVLTLGGLSLMPSLASAESANGKFTLTHEVHWQNAVVPAGTY